MSSRYSALWSSLRTLELTSQFTSIPVDPPVAYETTFFCDNKQVKLHIKTERLSSFYWADYGRLVKLHKRHQKVASALALIGATSSDAKTVTACSAEVSYASDSNHTVIILRVAQNQRMQGRDISKLQNLVDGLLGEISRHEQDVWADKTKRHATIRSVVIDFFLPQVVERCRDKLSHILGGPYSKTFRDWYADITEPNPLEGGDRSLDPVILECSELINRCSSERIPERRNADDVFALVYAISNASIIIDAFAGSLEERWAIYDSKISHDKVAGQGEADGGGTDVDEAATEDLDDRESFDQIEMARSSIYRFLRKLFRYYIACRNVTSELVAIVRSGAKLDITVETVPISMTTSTPANENEYPSFESFFELCVRADVKSLDPKKIDRLRDRWARDRKSQNLFLHAEMQIALFYALNPQLFPVQGFIGVSKKSCWCCDFVLKHLQIPSEQDRRYDIDIAGPPLLFSVQGTHSRKYSSWVFPNPSIHTVSSILEDIPFNRVCRRFELVREDLEDALRNQVNDIVGKLQKPDYASDSSGLEDDDWNDHLELMEEVRTRARARAPDPGQGEGKK
ncbi:hypothetical protein PILCRDRAFT_7235 [Piloderma croceum F 1598]|uniref:Uncharacterized protein n=1 Tax=Piloderma croceum (strain F 1598) TaxID=765440 RepID=A0A0C3C122_PILCF|nr:hypothetical protein PILCRDRAFT_7235 [Piloderma croceum F 1598]